MFAQKISPADLIDIIAAPSYCPNLLSYVNKISDANLLKDYLTKKAKLGVTGTIAKDYVEPYRVCRRPTFLRECPDDKTKIYP